jgi:hypothetical protein
LNKERSLNLLRPAGTWSGAWQNADPYAALVAVLDDGFMQLYAHARRNARRMTRIAVTLLPLVMLLVSSCKTASMNESGLVSSKSEQVRSALFPDRSLSSGDGYFPAAGYLARARGYIADAPEILALLTDKEIGYLFGKPSLARKDADVRVLQYKAESCIVDFYFYGDFHKKADRAVSYVDVRLQDAVVSPDTILPEKLRAQCIGHILDQPDLSAPRI